MDSGCLQRCSITAPLGNSFQIQRGLYQHPPHQCLWDHLATLGCTLHAQTQLASALATAGQGDISTSDTAPSQLQQHQGTAWARDQSVWRMLLSERKAFTTKTFRMQYPSSKSAVWGQSADNRHGTVCNRILKDAATRRQNSTRFDFVLPDPCKRAYLMRKERLHKGN